MAPVGLDVDYLNHASVLLDFGQVRLLSDPWYEGTAFFNGWGLEYEDPDAYRRAARATHLWISHWHSDHLHVPTLKKLAEQRPDLVVLANESANFSMTERMRKLGFGQVLSLGERRPVQLGHDVRVTRYPTAGIDNMLHVEAGRWSILNYNDCNLPQAAVRRMVGHMGRVDLMLTNYNHAGKLFDRDDDETRRHTFLGAARRAVDAVGPRWVIPFASSHYYRCSFSREQNRSLWSFDELEAEVAGDPRFVVLRVGDRAHLCGQGAQLVKREPALTARPHDVLDYGESADWAALVEACAERCRDMSSRFLGAARLLPTLRVHVRDHDRSLALRAGRGASETSEAPHVAAHSQAVLRWLGRPFGDDTFFAGAHFAIVDRDTRAIRKWALVTLLDGSHLTPRHALGFLRHADGRRFLWNRREEAAATVLGARLRAGQVRA